MSFLIIVDNGQDCSDHSHWPVCTCITRADAEAAKARYDDWKKRAIAFIRGDDEDVPEWGVRWERAKAFISSGPFPEPFSDRDFSAYDIDDYYCEIIEVPDWAEQ